MSKVYINKEVFDNLADAMQYISEKTDLALADCPDNKKVEVVVAPIHEHIDEHIRLSFITTLENK